VNRSSKLFIAAVILAVGYGVASHVGAPKIPFGSASSASRPALVNDSPKVEVAMGIEPRPQAVGGVRLLPDMPAAEPVRTAPSPPILPLQLPSPPMLSTAIAATLPGVPTTSGVEISESPAVSSPNVLARFSEAPVRPILANELKDSFETKPATTPALPAKGTSQFAPISNAATSSRRSVVDLQAGGTALPPPYVELPRTHTVIDGDSLPKLAKRYLNDPARADEIFAANRSVLSSRELLPIGEELTIPPRTTAAARGD
jgi:nucleoid-associated protein YgaU